MFVRNLLEEIRKKGRLPEKNSSDPQRKKTQLFGQLLCSNATCAH